MKKLLLMILITPIIFLGQEKMRLSEVQKLSASIGKYGVDTMRCEEHLSIYTEFYKQKSYESAFDSWLYLFINAPKRTKNIYIHGATMYKNFIKNELDSVQKEGLIDDLLQVYNHRNYYYPGQEGMVLGMQGAELYRNRKSDMSSVQKAYEILKESFILDQAKTQARALNYYFQAGAKLTSNKLLSKEELIDLFSDLSTVIDYKEADINQKNFDLNSKENLTSKEERKLKNNIKELKTLGDVRANMEKILAPHVTCEKLVQLYTDKFQINQEDFNWLERAAQLLKKKDCTDSNIYFQIAGKLYESNPTPRSAFYMGVLSVRQENYSQANIYFTQAVDGETDNIKKADYLYYLASTYAAMDQYKTAKKYALDANRLRSSWGKPYMLIGDLYAKTSRSCGENTGDTQNDEFTKRVGYWAAIEKYQHAKRLDPSFAADANKKIKTYTDQMPDKTSTFQIIGLDKKTYTINCWYQEVVQNPYYKN